MKTLTFFLFLTLFASSCMHNNALKGTWIHAYQIHYSSDTPSYTGGTSIFQFDGKEVRIIDLDEPNDSAKGTYRLGRREVTFSMGDSVGASLKVVSLARDSFVVEMVNDYRREVVFRRLNESAFSGDVDFVGHFYQMHYNGYDCTLQFVSDSVVLRVDEFGVHADPWSIQTFDDYRFLVTGQPGIAFLLIETAEGTIELKSFGRKGNKATLKEGRVTRDAHRLIGNWIESRVEGDLPPRPPNYQNVRLEIKQDSMKITQYHWTRSVPWILDATNKFIFFPLEGSSSGNLWRIVEVEAGTLKIYRGWDDNLNGIEWTEFIREN